MIETTAAPSLNTSLRPEFPTLRRLRVALGTLVAIECSSHSLRAAEAAVEAAFAALHAVERQMHPYRASSDLARINVAPLHTPVAVHAGTVELLQLAQRLNGLTEAVFDPCLPCKPGRLSDICVEVGVNAATTGSPADCDFRVTCHAPVALDFGGFAKGYAVDRAIAALVACGTVAGLVNAGGDLRVFGPRTEPLLLRGPSGEFTRLELVDAALAVSDADSRHKPTQHQGYYARNNTAPDPLANRFAAVTATEAVIADALVKCVLLCSTRTADRALREFGARRLSGFAPQ